jgi:hypothetical protein
MSQIITPSSRCDGCGQPVGASWVFHADTAKLLCYPCQINAPRNRPAPAIVVDEAGCPVRPAPPPVRVNGSDPTRHG